MNKKPKLSYLLDFPNAIEEIAYAMMKSEEDEKYSRFEWKEGCPLTKSMDSILRHASDFHNCQDNDHESRLSNLAAIAVNAFFALENYKRHGKEVDDRDHETKR